MIKSLSITILTSYTRIYHSFVAIGIVTRKYPGVCCHLYCYSVQAAHCNNTDDNLKLQDISGIPFYMAIIITLQGLLTITF